MRMPVSDSDLPMTTAKEKGIEHQCSDCEMKEEEEKMEISRKPSATSNLEANDEVMNEINNTRSGSGSPLDASTKDFMERGFGYDFSKVRIHNDEKAVKSVDSVNALAYTLGQDIVFGTDQYKPGTVKGRKLLAHELVHTIQQSSVINSNNIIQRQGQGQPQQPQLQQQNPALAEWNAHPGIHHHFDHGFQTYSQLRPLYQNIGVPNPAAFIVNNIITLSFFARRTPAHQDLRVPLQTAEAALTSQWY